MQSFNGNDKISIYGILNIKYNKKGTTTNIEVSAENKRIEEIGEYLYNILFRKYEIFNYDWDSVEKKIKTTKLIINDKEISHNCKFKISGYVEVCGGIPWENGKRYEFYTEDISFDELIATIEVDYEDYIVDFDTDENGLKFVITNFEVI